MRAARTILSCLFLCVGLAKGAAGGPFETWAEAGREATRLYELGDCDGAWKVVWPWAKAGNSEARFALATGITYAGLVPPGQSDDIVSRWRNIAVLMVFTDRSAVGEFSDTYNTLIKIVSETVLRPHGREETSTFETCLESESHANCPKIAVTAGLVPTFDEYASEIDAIGMRGGLSRKATCSEGAINRDKFNPDRK